LHLFGAEYPPHLSSIYASLGPSRYQRKTRGRADRYSFLVRLFHPLLQAGLARRTVTKFFFKTIDPIPGPPDPEVFADELFLELYEPDSDHYWGQSYFVATPSGLATILRQKSWRYLHAYEVLVLSRYDLPEIRRAVVARILADHDFFNGSEQNFEEEAL
jgi:hypothetical protein